MLYQCARILFLTMPLWQQGCIGGTNGGSDDTSTKASTTKPGTEKDKGDGEKSDGKNSDGKKGDGKKSDGGKNAVTQKSLEDQMREAGQQLGNTFKKMGAALETAGSKLDEPVQKAHTEIGKVIDTMVKAAGKTADEIKDQISPIVIEQLKSAMVNVLKAFENIDWDATLQETQQKAEQIWTLVRDAITETGKQVTAELQSFDADGKISKAVTQHMNTAFDEIKTVAEEFILATKELYEAAEEDVETALQTTQTPEFKEAVAKINTQVHTIIKSVIDKSNLTAHSIRLNIGKAVTQIGKALKLIGPEALVILNASAEFGEDMAQVLTDAFAAVDKTVQEIWSDIGLKTFEMSKEQIENMLDSTKWLTSEVFDHFKKQVGVVVEVHLDQTKVDEIIKKVDEGLSKLDTTIKASWNKIHDELAKTTNPLFDEIEKIVKDSWTQIKNNTEIRTNLEKVQTEVHDTIADIQKTVENVVDRLSNDAQDVINEVGNFGKNVYDNVVHKVMPDAKKIFNDVIQDFSNFFS